MSEGDVMCTRCGERGYALDEFVSPYSGLCAKCSKAERDAAFERIVKSGTQGEAMSDWKPQPLYGVYGGEPGCIGTRTAPHRLIATMNLDQSDCLEYANMFVNAGDIAADTCEYHDHQYQQKPVELHLCTHETLGEYYRLHFGALTVWASRERLQSLRDVLTKGLDQSCACETIELENGGVKVLSTDCPEHGPE